MAKFQKILNVVFLLVLGSFSALGVLYAYKLITNSQFIQQRESSLIREARANNYPQQEDDNKSMHVQPASSNIIPNTGQMSFSPSIQKVAPSIVNVYTQAKVNGEMINTYGSGIIMSQDGYILTNYHVVAKATEYVVTLNNGTVFAAKLVGADSLVDLAVLKVDTDNTHPLKAIDLKRSSADVNVGDLVIAIGNPLNLGQSATIGIVSAVGRSTVDRAGYQQLIQTDVALNTGNSGGALINTNGELIGINTLIVNEAYGSQVSGLGFAIPVATAVTIMNQIITTGKAEHAYFGAQTVNLKDASNRNKVVINAISPNSPAYEAGLRLGDTILSINGISVDNLNPMLALLNSSLPGDQLVLEVMRKGQYTRVSCTLGKLSDYQKQDTQNRRAK